MYARYRLNIQIVQLAKPSPVRPPCLGGGKAVRPLLPPPAPLQLRPFLNIGAITPLGAAPAGFAQQCPRCDNSSSEVGLHKIPCTWGELSTA